MSTVRDRFWIFTCVAGSDDPSLEKGGFPQGSRMTSAEGAFYLAVPNLIMVRWEGLPARPYDPYAIAFRPLRRVLWSFVGSGGRVDDDELGSILGLADRFPNITGAIMDDFFTREGEGRLTLEDVDRIRAKLDTHPRELDLWVVLYTHQLELPVAPYLDRCDVVSLWTWNADQLDELEGNLQRLEGITSGRRIALGCYMWDFPNARPVPLPAMQNQCRLGLQWILESRIEAMVFLANTVCDLDLEVVEWTRAWIREVWDTRLVI